MNERQPSADMRAVQKVSSHSEYLKNKLCGLVVIWQPVKETLLWIREQSLSRGASQSAVRHHWLSLYTVWPSHSRWPSDQISFIKTMCLPILQLLCSIFWQSITSPKSVSHRYSPDLAPCNFWLFSKLKSPLKRRRLVNATVTQYISSVNGVSLPTD